MKIVFAPSSYHYYLYSLYRKDDSYNDVKIYTKEDLIDSYYGVYQNNPLIYLMDNYGYSYEFADEILKYIRFIEENKENEKLKELFLIKEDLIKKSYLIKTSLLYSFIQNKTIELYGYNQEDENHRSFVIDRQLDYLFKKANVNINHHFLSRSTLCENPIYAYDNEESETLFTLNRITSLIDSGVKVEDIVLYFIDSSYNYYFDLYSKSFGLFIDLNENDSFFITSFCKEFLKLFASNKDVSASFEIVSDSYKDDETLMEYSSYILDNTYESLDFEKQMDVYKHVFKTIYLKKKKYCGKIKVISHPTLLTNKYIFILGFRQNSFPPSYKDYDYLSDTLKSNINLNTTSDLSPLFRKSFFDFLKLDNKYYLSFAYSSTSEEYSVSPYACDLHLEIKKDSLPSIFYSKVFIDYLHTASLDKNRLYLEKDENYFSLENYEKLEDYFSYDNQYSGINLIDTSNKNYSYSSIKTFYECPFKYYLSRILKIDHFSSNFNTNLGTVAHDVLSKAYDPDFDFDREFARSIYQFDWTTKEKFYIELIKPCLSVSIEAIKNQLSFVRNPTLYLEKNCSYRLDDKTIINGTIDKIVCFEDYFYIVDYKTGSESFNPDLIEYGFSLQLPTYLLLASSFKGVKDYTICGVYINHILPNSILDIQSNIPYQKYLKLDGRTINDLNIASKLDSSFVEGSSSYIASLGYKKKEDTFTSRSKVIFSSEFTKYRIKAEEKYTFANESIRNFKFPIKPVLVKKKSVEVADGCKYCTYKDICFVKIQKQQDFIRLVNQDEEVNDEQ